MTRDGKLISYQADLQAGAMFSTIQPAVYFRSAIRGAAIADFFTTPQALAYVHLRKEGDTYVRN
jgi:hypothetical protein